MTDYVCGFLFDHGRNNVALIEKKRPAWQAGRLNGVGGKIEPGESPLEAMVREFHEEADLSGIEWEPIVELAGPDFTVYFFAGFSHHAAHVASMTDEVVALYPVDRLQYFPLLPNLRVFIPLALDRSGIQKPVLMLDGVPDHRTTAEAA